MDTTPSSPQPTPVKGYGKRPLWQWILIYLIVGGLVYSGIYYFAYAKKGNNNGNQNTSQGLY